MNLKYFIMVDLLPKLMMLKNP